MILTETWLNERDNYPEKFLSPKNFYSKSRSPKTGVNNGRGVAIWVPRNIFSKQRNDLNVLNETFCLLMARNIRAIGYQNPNYCFV